MSNNDDLKFLKLLEADPEYLEYFCDNYMVLPIETMIDIGFHAFQLQRELPMSKDKKERMEKLLHEILGRIPIGKFAEYGAMLALELNSDTSKKGKKDGESDSGN